MILEKIDISEIVSEHLKTLRDENTGRGSTKELLIFFIFPFVISSALLLFKLVLGKDMINILIASLSIFVGLLLNLLMLLIAMLDKCKEKINLSKEQQNPADISKKPFFSFDINMLEKRQKLLRDSYHNISFAILLSLLTIPIMIIALANNEVVVYISNFFGYMFLTIFLLTLFMILKRVHLLLSSDT